MEKNEFITLLLGGFPSDTHHTTLMGFIAVLLSSVVLAILISALYRRYFDANSTGSSIHRSFPLIAPAVTTIFITVQFSLPLSLGLLGALSIVRFRTPIKEPEEIGFLMVVIACAISLATFNFVFAFSLYLAVFLFLFVRSKVNIVSRASDSKNAILSLTISKHNGSQPPKVEEFVEYFRSKNVDSSVLSLQSGADEMFVSLIMPLSGAAANQVMDDFAVDYPSIVFNYYKR